MKRGVLLEINPANRCRDWVSGKGGLPGRFVYGYVVSVPLQQMVTDDYRIMNYMGTLNWQIKDGLFEGDVVEAQIRNSDDKTKYVFALALDKANHNQPIGFKGKEPNKVPFEQLKGIKKVGSMIQDQYIMRKVEAN
jgi:hypothetical protein